MTILYFLIAFGATLFGALVGLGGGVIIKPALDILNQFDALTISALSSTTILIMSIVTLLTNVKNGITVERRLFPIAFGAVLGGYFGKVLFSHYIFLIKNDYLAKGIQAFLLGVIMMVVYFLISKEIKRSRIANPLFNTLVGVGLGILSSFLGIGGGPLNVIILVMFCGLEKKYAAFGSVFLIFASQGTKVMTLLIQGSYSLFNVNALMGLIPGGILGGYYGSRLYRQLNSETIIRVFKIAVVILGILNFYVAYTFLTIA